MTRYTRQVEEGREVLWEALDAMAASPGSRAKAFDVWSMMDTAHELLALDGWWQARDYQPNPMYSRAKKVIQFATEQGWVELVQRGGRGLGPSVYKLTERAYVTSETDG